VIAPAEAARIALAEFGLGGTATRLDGEYDDNFLLETPEAQYVLKIMHTGADAAVVDMQAAALRHLAKVPRVIGEPRIVDGRIVWLLSFVEGRLYAHVRPHSEALLESLGATLASYDTGLKDFAHPASHRALKWDLARAEWALQHADERMWPILEHYVSHLQPRLSGLRAQVIHNDANDYNVVVADGAVTGIIDFGDMLHAPLICEVAIAAAYALMGNEDVLAALRALVRGYHRVLPLLDDELALLLPLIQTRLAVSVVNSTIRCAAEPDNEYLRVSEAPACALLERLRLVHPRLALYHLRSACGLRVVPSVALPRAVAPVIAGVSTEIVDLAPGSDCEIDRVTGGIGRYAEPRLVYTSGLFARSSAPTAERRTIHLGLDLFAPAGTPVMAPLDGVVHAKAFNDAPLDYGPVVVLKHEGFFTLYSHLSAETLSSIEVGDTVKAGQPFASLGAKEINGGWTPHLHMQVLLDDLDDACDFPGVAYPSEFEIFRELSPDPNRILQLPVISAFENGNIEDLTRERRASIGPNLSVSYAKPIAMARGWMQYLYDTDGQRYLDFYNNVPHVGHCHPHVVRAVQKQLATLNTNTRYLNEALARYARALTAKMPEPLRVVFLTASGSEANELAIRLARTYTGRRDIAVMASGYHGHTNTMIDVSEYKFAGPGGAGKPDWVRLVPVADPYRNLAGCVFPADAVRGAAAFLCESFPSVGGQIVFPEGYLQSAYAATRAVGGVCIADEVQTGFGRLGSHFWGFDAHGALPDIVALGKPIGNGFPMGAVVTTRAIADAFANGMEFFSTFGGSNAACAAGLAVLEVIEREGLQEHARVVGDRLLAGLRSLNHELIGDVRGAGLFLGIELVEDRETKAPAARDAARLVNRFRDHGILLGTDGPLHNVIKLRGPLPLTFDDADFFVEVFAKLLRENA